MLLSRLPHQLHGHGHITAIGNPHRQNNAQYRITQRPVEQPAGDELLVGHQQLLAVKIANGGGADADTRDYAVGGADGHHIAHTDGSLKEDDDAADEVGDDLLQAKTDTHAERCHQPLDLRPTEAEHIGDVEDTGSADAVAGKGYHGVAAAGAHLQPLEQDNL